MSRKNEYNNFQLNKISKEAFAKERGQFLRFFAIFMLGLICLCCVLFPVKTLYMYLCAAFLYLLSIAFCIRGMNKEYRLSPLYVKADGRCMEICYNKDYFLRVSFDEIDYIAQFYRVSRKYRLLNHDIFRGYNKGEVFWLRYKYIEENYRLKKFIKEGWIEKKDKHDLDFLKRISKRYESKDKKLKSINVENIKSLQLLSEPRNINLELHVYDLNNKKHVFNYGRTTKKLALVIIKCYKIESLYHISFKWQNNSCVPFFEDKNIAELHS
ncbi:MAG: hypothetical protein LBK56_08145 [Gracilibacteraceae bacterium]|jgi:hypothetical protein|nr:hypothetical protein [Gracilibacteraceae bacterium]